MRRCIPVIALLALSGCASTQNDGLFTGENLMQPMPLPEEAWVAYQKQQNGIYQRLWSKNDNRDQLKTDVFYQTPNRGVEQEKLVDDKVGHDKCASFESSDAEVIHQNSYPSLTWLSICQTVNGVEIAVLHKAISGRDSFYHLRRIWKQTPSKEQMATWQAYFSTIQLCDTRSRGDNRCPDGYRQVQEP